MREEWHVTIDNPDGCEAEWKAFCRNHGIKPLWIELNNFERQLMCAAGGSQSPDAMIAHFGWTITRIKHEVQPVKIDVRCHQDTGPRWLWPEGRDAIYYECHVKLDGKFQPDLFYTSRDLFRESRWYATHRSPRPFDPAIFVQWVTDRTPGSTIAGWEYEAAILDTNAALDVNWGEGHFPVHYRADAAVIEYLSRF